MSTEDEEKPVKPKPAPECMQDGPKPEPKVLEEINLRIGEGTPRPMFVSAALESGIRKELILLLQEYSDVFAWHYEELPGLDTKLVSHNLSVFPNSKLIKQAPRKYQLELEEKIKEEIEKLRKAGFIQPTQYPLWLANIVPVKNKNGQIRVCVDFRNLNKSCPKDEFPLSHVDTLVDVTSGH